MQASSVTGDSFSMPLYKIIYRSQMVQRPDAEFEAEVARIIGVSREWNAANGITGALMLTTTGYAQVLEGSHHDVKSLFGHISCDKRHHDIELLYNESHEERDFGNWAMAVVGAPNQLDIELASTAYQRDIVLDNGASDILAMLRWLLVDEPSQKVYH